MFLRDEHELFHLVQIGHTHGRMEAPLKHLSGTGRNGISRLLLQMMKTIRGVKPLACSTETVKATQLQVFLIVLAPELEEL